jgi:hypothetical protein
MAATGGDLALRNLMSHVADGEAHDYVLREQILA